MYNETIQRLEKFSDTGEFERLCCDILSRIGYRGIEPQGVGKKDGGKDVLHFADDHKTVIHISLREDWEKNRRKLGEWKPTKVVWVHEFEVV